MSALSPAVRKRRNLALAVSLLLKGLGLACLVGALLTFSQMNSHENGALVRIGFGGATGLLTGGGVVIYRFAKRFTTRAAQEVLMADKRPAVLYLRSFKDDDVMDQTNASVPLIPSLTTEEEQLARAFRDFGPFVAVGTPSETMPQAGAARFQFHESEWRDRVLELMDRAGLVVLRIAATEGLAWEVSMAAWRLAPSKLVLVIPGNRKLYEEFAALAGPRFRKPLPEYRLGKKNPPPGTVRAIVRFNEDWESEFIPLRVPRMRAGKPLTVALRAALGAVAKANGITAWRPPGYSWVKIGVAIAIPLLIVWTILTNHR